MFLSYTFLYRPNISIIKQIWTLSLREMIFFAKWYLEAACLHLVVTFILFSITSLSISFSIIVYEYKSMKLTLIYILIVKGSYIFFLYILYFHCSRYIIFNWKCTTKCAICKLPKKIDCNSYSFKLTRLKYTLSS